MALTTIVRDGRPTLGAVYVVAALAVTLLLMLLVQLGALTPSAVLLVIAMLGPLATIVTLFLGHPAPAPGFPYLPWPAYDAIVLASVALIAVANVVIARRAAALTAGSATATWPGRLAPVPDRVIGVILFLLAGGVFILLCVLTGFVFVVSGASVVPVPGVHAATARTTAVLTFAVGFVAAVAGVVLLIVAAARRTPMVRWAAVDLMLQVGLLAAMYASNLSDG